MTSTLTRMDSGKQAALRALLVAEAAATPAATPAAAPGAARGAARGAAPGTARPVWRRPVVRRVGLGLASATAVTVTVVAVTSVVMLARDPAAPASSPSWTAAPATAPGATLDPDDLKEWTAKCTAVIGPEFSSMTMGVEPPPIVRHSTLVDQRGDWTFCVDFAKWQSAEGGVLFVLSGVLNSRMGKDSRSAGMLKTPSFTWPTGSDILLLGGIAKGQIKTTTAETSSSATGPMGPDVAGVDLNLADGQVITATLHDDFWAAWWPRSVGTADVDTFTVRTKAGGTREIDPDSVTYPRKTSGHPTCTRSTRTMPSCPGQPSHVRTR